MRYYRIHLKLVLRKNNLVEYVHGILGEMLFGVEYTIECYALSQDCNRCQRCHIMILGSYPSAKEVLSLTILLHPPCVYGFFK